MEPYAVIANKDIFKDQFQFKSHPPKVVVGPDSTPTLSFTSGSEGVPKGVRGRHFSLTYYFPWMAETFGLSENDHFTMLSGIAHDPIQRDSTYTPLFIRTLTQQSSLPCSWAPACLFQPLTTLALQVGLPNG